MTGGLKRDSPFSIDHVFSSESQSAERLNYVGDVAPPTRIPVESFTWNEVIPLSPPSLRQQSADLCGVD